MARRIEEEEWNLDPGSPLHRGAVREADRGARRGPSDAGARRSVSKEEYCYRCGTPWEQGALQCPKCRSSDRSVGEARPTRSIEGESIRFPGPWEMVPWPPQGNAMLWGGPGAGKSSIAAMTQPTLWLTSEQQPKPVADMFRRIYGDDRFIPRVLVVSDAQDVENALRTCQKGPIVLDSYSQLGLVEGAKAARIMVAWAQRKNDRSLGIAQITKGSQAAGFTEIPHLVDFVAHADVEGYGKRCFRIEKSRWSPLDSIYWTFSKEGKVEKPSFPAAYSVEGDPGSYALIPYPLGGAKWAQGLAVMSETGQLKPGMACSLIRADYMPTGFLEPDDIYERQRFAERHGLRWVSAEEILIPEEKPGKKSKK